jgi:murein DD-endopeptidase MepM/ murein hydrolase activator NlpD
MAVERIVVSPAAEQQFRRALAFGSHNFGLAVEAASKRNTPVRGGHRSFAPDGPVGGNLRRSEHTVTYLDGQRIAGNDADENGQSVPAYPAGDGIVTVVGTNCGYGLFVHDGTVKMPARPFIAEGLAEERPNAVELIHAGAARHLRS